MEELGRERKTRIRPYFVYEQGDVKFEFEIIEGEGYHERVELFFQRKCTGRDKARVYGSIRVKISLMQAIPFGVGIWFVFTMF